ncbi:hypothetical protein DNR46_36105 [Mesorhizobium japonicum]|uniref:Uncharacterized protein n=1 Tax=Mesorhizobium japonicum TaxID=2066070 RepID=A0A3M9WZZ9_9HYPH|nr:hypothetical protein DNR46_36105 [Mesorhizobium japonicum]
MGRYDRRHDVAPLLGQGEFKRLLGSTEREALRNYPKVNGEFERLVAETRRRGGANLPAETALEVHRLAERRAEELAATFVHIGGRTLPGSHPDAADVIRESYLSRSEREEDQWKAAPWLSCPAAGSCPALLPQSRMPGSST